MPPLPKRFSLNFTAALSLSALIHLAVFIILNTQSKAIPSTPVVVEVSLGGPDGKKEGTESTKTDIIDKGDGGRDCSKWFGGIGITLGLGTEIDKVHEGYPAHKAGILKGDNVIAKEEIRGEPGTQLVLLVVRGSKEFEVTLTREKICYD